MKAAWTILLGAGLAACAGPAQERAVFGNLHAHTRFSDGVVDVEQAFQQARRAGLGFQAVTDHGEELDPSEWRALRRAAAAAGEPGRFAALAGWEWSSGSQGHFLVLGAEQHGSSCAEPASLEALAAWARDRGALLIYAHPGTLGEYGAVLASGLGRRDLIAQEIGSLYSGPAGSGYSYRDFEDAYRESLRRGLMVGAVINQDNHHDRVGHARRGGFTGLWLREVEPRSVLAALAARRSFATESFGFAVDLEIAGARMGGRARARKRLPVRAYLHGFHVGRVFAKAELYAVRSGRAVWTWLRAPADDWLTAELEAPRAPEVYYLRVELVTTFGVRARAFSSPIWIEAGADPLVRGARVEPPGPAPGWPATTLVRLDNAGTAPAPAGELTLRAASGFAWRQPVPLLDAGSALDLRLPLVVERDDAELRLGYAVPGHEGGQLELLLPIEPCVAEPGGVEVVLENLERRELLRGRARIEKRCWSARELLEQVAPVEICGGLLRRVGPLAADPAARTAIEILLDGARAEVGVEHLMVRAGQTLTCRLARIP